MILCDVNVFVYAHKEGAAHHAEWNAWLGRTLGDDEAFGVSELVLSSFLRVVTHPRIFDVPSEWAAARAFADVIRHADNAVVVAPGARHWRIFTDLVDASGARGNAVPDAYLAAMAIESGSTWISADKGFGRYPGLRWTNPLS